MNVIHFLTFLTLIGQLASSLEWDEFKRQYDKFYENQIEESMRRDTFYRNKAKIEKFNQEKSTKLGFKQGLNHLADRFDEELFGKRKRINQLPVNSPEAQKFLDNLLAGIDVHDLPAEVDYTKEDGRVSSVADQNAGHNCNSDWAFSAVGALEGQMKVRNVTFQPLSVQNMIDCSNQTFGCSAGIQKLAWQDIGRLGGIQNDESYPYQAQRQKCKFEKSEVVFNNVIDGANLNTNDEATLQKVVATFGPVSVVVDGFHSSFKFYREGVFYETGCGTTHYWDVETSLLVVGYGTDSATGADYWLAKNSWGINWGINGYIKMARNRNNNCGIASLAMIPTF